MRLQRRLQVARPSGSGDRIFRIPVLMPQHFAVSRYSARMALGFPNVPPVLINVPRVLACAAIVCARETTWFQRRREGVFYAIGAFRTTGRGHASTFPTQIAAFDRSRTHT